MEESIYVLSEKAVNILLWLCKKVASAPPDMSGYITTTEFNPVKNKLDSYPEITEAMKKDNIHYAFLNGKFENIADPTEQVSVCDRDTPTSIALEAIEAGKFTYPMDEKTIEEVRKAIDDDNLFNELAANSFATLENQMPPKTDKELIAEAKAEYYRRKEEALKERAVEDVSALDVLPKNEEKS